ncbi:uncharacterized protein LOC108452575 isoform X3 [Gossypium arboreum]|uniref:uncharacterized protein LOC108452575 isoform X3 n=1 Tax=Gossypium arboreum TaxID=29729 RepID=UPI0008195B1B|nr:uncharacterized protein LOC108452575 isoform X3 [Gossypium arboreum]
MPSILPEVASAIFQILDYPVSVPKTISLTTSSFFSIPFEFLSSVFSHALFFIIPFQQPFFQQIFSPIAPWRPISSSPCLSGLSSLSVVTRVLSSSSSASSAFLDNRFSRIIPNHMFQSLCSLPVSRTQR